MASRGMLLVTLALNRAIVGTQDTENRLIEKNDQAQYGTQTKIEPINRSDIYEFNDDEHELIANKKYVSLKPVPLPPFSRGKPSSDNFPELYYDKNNSAVTYRKEIEKQLSGEKTDSPRQLGIQKAIEWINSNDLDAFHYDDGHELSVNKEYENLEPFPLPCSSETPSCGQSSKLCNAENNSSSFVSTSDQNGDYRDFDFEPWKDSESSEAEENFSETNESVVVMPIEDIVINTTPKKKPTKNKKEVQCKYCEIDVISKNFVRHLKRHHENEKEVENILKHPKNSKERRRALGLLRNTTNFDLFLTGVVRPIRQLHKNEKNEYFPCHYCKGLFLKHYLKRHAKYCSVKKQNQISRPQNEKVHHLACSQTAIACAMDLTNVISKLDVKMKVFDIMKPDQISLDAKKDLLIAHIGESYLKKHKRERMVYATSNKMRELARLLITYRTLTNNENMELKDMIHPKNFDNVILATREIAGYNPEKKSFKAPSLAMHIGTSLKDVCDECIHLILRQNRGFRTKSVNEQREWIQNIKFFKELIHSRWNIELASLANKDLLEKRWNKPVLLPLVSDIKIFREGVTKVANECQQNLAINERDEKAYKLLTQSALALLILFNRRRIGDVQYLKIKDYLDDKRTNMKDFENALTEAEKILTMKYKRVINSGKGSRAVVILVPEFLQKIVDLLLKLRPMYIPPENEYVFAIPGSTIKWGKGDVAIKTLCKKIKLENHENITSNKLRKQIATVMQILNLSKDESKQFANFMGHTQKTHDEFYELPVDIYQTAKVSKLLLMMEKGSVPLEYKGKSLAEINIDPNSELVEEENDNDEGVVFLENNNFESRDITNDLDDIDLDQPESKDDSEIIEDTDLTCLGSSKQLMITKEKHLPQNEENFQTDYMSDSLDIDREEFVTKQKRVKKQGWTDIEIQMIKNEFNIYIQKNSYPSGKIMKDFLKKNNIKKTIPLLRSKIQHLNKLHFKS